MDIDINTEAYETQHGSRPHHNKRGDWTFKPPRGGRVWRWLDTPYGVACKELEERAQRNVGEGTYILIP